MEAETSSDLRQVVCLKLTFVLVCSGREEGPRARSLETFKMKLSNATKALVLNIEIAWHY